MTQRWRQSLRNPLCRRKNDDCLDSSPLIVPSPPPLCLSRTHSHYIMSPMPPQTLVPPWTNSNNNYQSQMSNYLQIYHKWFLCLKKEVWKHKCTRNIVKRPQDFLGRSAATCVTDRKVTVIWQYITVTLPCAGRANKVTWPFPSLGTPI